jgi:hypothetical protein
VTLPDKTEKANAISANRFAVPQTQSVCRGAHNEPLSPRYASAIQVIRPLGSKAETQNRHVGGVGLFLIVRHHWLLRVMVVLPGR